MSTLAQQVPSLADPVERRFYPRVVPQVPIFLIFSENGPADTLLLNISENGLLISTPVGLPRNLVTRLFIPLSNWPNSVRVTVRVMWASEEGNLAGIQLLDLCEHDRQQIRKWGERESTRSPRAEPVHSSVVVPASSNPSEPVGAARISGQADASSGGTREIVPVAPPRTIRFRPVLSLARRTALAGAIATICLAAVMLLPKASPTHRFVAPRASRPSEANKNTSAAPTAGGANEAAAQLLSPIPATPAKAKDSASDQLPRASQQIEPAAASVGLATEVIPDNINDNSSREPITSEQAVSETTLIPAPSPDLAQNTATTEDSAFASVHADGNAALAETTTVSTGLSAMVPVVRATTPNLDSPAASPGNSAAKTPASASANPPVVPRLAPSLKPGAPARPPVIQMDVPPTRTLEVRLPSGYQAPFVNLPDERILESPTVTMHIQRSVHIPATGWAFHRYKKVTVGELISRVDPQPAQIAAGSAAVVKVRATIAKDGRLGSVNLILGPPSLVPTVANALREWRYQPTMVDGKPAETQSYIVFQFHAPAYRAAKRE